MNMRNKVVLGTGSVSQTACKPQCHDPMEKGKQCILGDVGTNPAVL